MFAQTNNEIEYSPTNRKRISIISGCSPDWPLANARPIWTKVDGATIAICLKFPRRPPAMS